TSGYSYLQNTSNDWQTIRSVQAELQAVLLNGAAPNVLVLTSLPTSTNPVNGGFGTFSLRKVSFLDGPYWDWVVGSLVTPSGTSGTITLTASGVTLVAFTA